VLREESIRRLEEEIRELEVKIDTLKEANETSELIEDRELSRKQKKYLLRETSLIQMYIPTTSYYQKERQSRHSWKARNSSSSEEEPQEQEIIDKVYTIEKVYAKHSNLSLTIHYPLSIAWDKPQRRFILRCPYDFKMVKPLHKIKTKLFLHLPGIPILDKKGILFLFLPAQQWTGMFCVFHINTSNGLTVYFTKKPSLEQITIPKRRLLGYLYAIAQLQEQYSH